MLLQSLPSLVFLLLGGGPFLLPSSHDLAEGIHDLIVCHADPLSQLLPAHFLLRQPVGTSQADAVGSQGLLPLPD